MERLNNDGVIQLFDTRSWPRIGPPIQAHKQSVESVAFASDGMSLLSNSNDGQLKVWNVDPKNWARLAGWPIGNSTANETCLTCGTRGLCTGGSGNAPLATARVSAGVRSG